jgi:hypothetical protein
MANETPSVSALNMDRGIPLGNSDDGTGRRALHVLDRLKFINKPFDSFSVAYPDTVTEVWTFTLASVTQQVATFVYTDSTKNFFVSGSIV